MHFDVLEVMPMRKHDSALNLHGPIPAALQPGLQPDRDGVPGILVEDFFPRMKFPDAFRGAKIYRTAHGEVIAFPFPKKHSGAKRQRKAAAPKPTP
ncbi:MAG: hypothetical protein WA238_07835 [Methylocella sp.]